MITVNWFLGQRVCLLTKPMMASFMSNTTMTICLVNLEIGRINHGGRGINTQKTAYCSAAASINQNRSKLFLMWVSNETSFNIESQIYFNVIFKFFFKVSCQARSGNCNSADFFLLLLWTWNKCSNNFHVINLNFATLFFSSLRKGISNWDLKIRKMTSSLLLPK